MILFNWLLILFLLYLNNFKACHHNFRRVITYSEVLLFAVITVYHIWKTCTCIDKLPIKTLPSIINTYVSYSNLEEWQQKLDYLDSCSYLMNLNLIRTTAWNISSIMANLISCSIWLAANWYYIRLLFIYLFSTVFINTRQNCHIWNNHMIIAGTRKVELKKTKYSKISYIYSIRKRCGGTMFDAMCSLVHISGF